MTTMMQERRRCAFPLMPLVLALSAPVWVGGIAMSPIPADIVQEPVPEPAAAIEPGRATAAGTDAEQEPAKVPPAGTDAAELDIRIISGVAPEQTATASPRYRDALQEQQRQRLALLAVLLNFPCKSKLLLRGDLAKFEQRVAERGERAAERAHQRRFLLRRWKNAAAGEEEKDGQDDDDIEGGGVKLVSAQGSKEGEGNGAGSGAPLGCGLGKLPPLILERILAYQDDPAAVQGKLALWAEQEGVSLDNNNVPPLDKELSPEEWHELSALDRVLRVMLQFLKQSCCCWRQPLRSACSPCALCPEFLPTEGDEEAPNPAQVVLGGGRNILSKRRGSNPGIEAATTTPVHPLERLFSRVFCVLNAVCGTATLPCWFYACCATCFTFLCCGDRGLGNRPPGPFEWANGTLIATFVLSTLALMLYFEVRPDLASESFLTANFTNETLIHPGGNYSS
jgi:hypothetical protein